MFNQVLNLVAGTIGMAASFGLFGWLVYYACSDVDQKKGDDNNEND